MHVLGSNLAFISEVHVIKKFPLFYDVFFKVILLHNFILPDTEILGRLSIVF